MMSAFTITILALTALIGGGTWFYMRQAGIRNEAPSGVSEKMKKPKKKQGTNVKDLWEIEDVRKGVLVLSGDRYRLICRMSAADFWLLSETEQNDVEDAAAAALMQLSFPVQVLTTSQAVDTKAAVNDLRQRAPGLSGALREMALARAEYLDALTKEKATSARQAYIVIPYDTVKGFNQAFGELHARLSLLADALSGAKVHTETLSSEAVVDLLAHMMNRGSAWRPSEAVEAGAMSLYSISERQVAQV